MTIAEFYQQIYYQNPPKDSAEFINIFESVDVSFDKEDNAETLRQMMRLTADYVHNLVRRESYGKALPVIKKAIDLFESAPDLAGGDLYNIPYYESLIASQAVANYYLKNYQTAKRDFNLLNQRFPDNDRYRAWQAAIEGKWIKTALEILLPVMALSVLGIYLFERFEIELGANICLWIGTPATLLYMGLSAYKWLKERPRRT